MATKRCTGPCGLELEMEMFTPNKNSKGGRLQVCVDCRREGRNAKSARDVALKVNYGISLVEYELMHEAQNGLCAICKEPEKGNRTLAVDHDHETGMVRSLLCFQCNTSIGKFGEDIPTILEAAKYLALWGHDLDTFYELKDLIARLS